MISDLSAASYLAYYLSACEANSLGNACIDTEHLWIGLCKVEDALNAKMELPPELAGIDQESALTESREFGGLLEACGVDCRKARRKMRALLMENKISEGPFTDHRTDRCKDVYLKAAKKSIDMGCSTIHLIHLFLAVIEQPSHLLDTVLSEFRITLDSLFGKKPAEPVVKTQSAAGKPAVYQRPMDPDMQNQPTKTPFLDQYGRNFTALAKNNQLDPVIGRSDIIKKQRRFWFRKRKTIPFWSVNREWGKPPSWKVSPKERQMKTPTHPSVISGFTR